MKKYTVLLLLLNLNLPGYTQSNPVYGLWVEDATDLTFFATTSPLTGVITTIDTLNTVGAIVLQTGTVNSASFLYTFRYLKSVGFGLLTVSLSSGAVVYDVPSEYNVVGLKYGCNGLINGLWLDSLDAYHFVKIDPATGDQTDLGIVPGLSGIFFGTFSFDINNRWYMFRGIDIDGSYHLYTIDAETGLLLYAPVSEDNVRGNEFDCVTNVTYGMWNDPVTDFEYFVSIDPVTGQYTLIDSLYTVSALISETYSINPNSSHYTFAGLQGPFYHLFSVDLASGNVTTDVAIDDVITETDQVSCCGKPTGDMEELIASIVVYPDPVSDYITVDQIPFEWAVIRILDVTGNLVFSKKVKEKSITCDVSELTSGLYFVQITNHEDVFISKFVKQ